MIVLRTVKSFGRIFFFSKPRLALGFLGEHVFRPCRRVYRDISAVKVECALARLGFRACEEPLSVNRHLLHKFQQQYTLCARSHSNKKLLLALPLISTKSEQAIDIKQHGRTLEGDF
jgi:hypothetical protein